MLEILACVFLLMPRRPLLKKYRFGLTVLIFVAISSGMIKEGREIVYLVVGIVGALIQIYSLMNVDKILEYRSLIQADEIKPGTRVKIKFALIGMLLLSFFVVSRGIFSFQK